jgi:hypothetical protein
MNRPATRLLAGVGVALGVLSVPAAAFAAPPVGECPTSFSEASVHETPASFLAAALKIDANDDLRVCLKPMANGAATNVIDNISHAR